MKTREQAEKRALELFPDTESSDYLWTLRAQQRKAYLKCWEDMQEVTEQSEQLVAFSKWKEGKGYNPIYDHEGLVKEYLDSN